MRTPSHFPRDSSSRRNEIFIAPAIAKFGSPVGATCRSQRSFEHFGKTVVYKYLAPSEPKPNWLNQAPAIIMPAFQVIKVRTCWAEHQLITNPITHHLFRGSNWLTNNSM